MGNIDLGTAFVTGKNRVPSPAVGITAFVTFCIIPPLFAVFFFYFSDFFHALCVSSSFKRSA